MNAAAPFPADVVGAMNALLASGTSPDPCRSFVETCRLALDAKQRASVLGDNLGVGETADRLQAIFEAGASWGAARATFLLSGSCLEEVLARVKANGNG